MTYLGNNHIGFDATELGFPSIAGCHAIVLVTANGLFGLHNMGGADPGQWEGRSTAFGTFVKGLGGSFGATIMYGVCYATGDNSRGYLDGGKTAWLNELLSFAKKVSYSGPIWGYDLADQPVPPSVTVMFSKVGATCVIQVKPYVPTEDTKGAILNAAHHKLLKPVPGQNMQNPGTKYMIDAITTQVVRATTMAPFKTVYPGKLRG